MPPQITTKSGFGSSGAVLMTGANGDFQCQIISSSPGSLVRIRTIIVSATVSNIGAPVNGLQIPVTVVRGGSSLGGTNGVAYQPVNAGTSPQYGLLLPSDSQFQIFLAKWVQIRPGGDGQLVFSPNELIARDGDKLAVTMGCAQDGSQGNTVVVVTTAQALTVLGDDLSGLDVPHQLNIGGNTGSARSLPRYDTSD